MRILKVKGWDVLLDDYDYVRFCHLKWKIRSSKDKNCKKYICCNKRVWIQSEQRFKRRTIYIHRAVMNPPYGLDLSTEEEIHHKNENELDNQRDNLEKLTREEHNKLTHGKRDDEELTCTCTEDCENPCKGECGCLKCSQEYNDFLSLE